jgi:Outer membrane lipoprotein-sorting protein
VPKRRVRMKPGNIGSHMICIAAMLFIAAVSLPMGLESAEVSALEVMQAVEDRDDGETMISKLTMILIDKKRHKRVRKIMGFRKDYGKDVKSINFFLSPPKIKNTAFLSYDWDDENKEDDNWLYLPALRKDKRISAAGKKDSFMGSDFSYSDMNGLELSDWQYRFKKRSVKIGGIDCWAIEGIPKKERAEKVIEETGYWKTETWVRKDIFMAIRSKLYVVEEVKSNKKIKYFMVGNISKIQGIWTAKKLSMKTTKNKRTEHRTILLFDDIVYNRGVDGTLFSRQQMKIGPP